MSDPFSTSRSLARWIPFVVVATSIFLLPNWQLPTHAQGLQFGTDSVEESTERLRPRASRSPEDDDRLLAAAQYSYGRLLLQREDTAKALRHLQRAYRWDPRATFIVRDIIPAASTLGRHAEAVRYAILAAERDPIDVKLLRPLGEILVQQGELERAVRMFEQALAHTDKSESTNQVLLRAEVARLSLLTGKVDRAAELFAQVRDAIADPDKSGVTGDAKKQLLEQRARLYPIIGETFFQAKRLDEALEMFRKSHEIEPNEPKLLVQLSRAAVEKGDWKNSHEHLKKYFAAKSTVAGAQPYELLSRTLRGELGDSSDTKAKLIAQLSQLRQQDRENSSLGLFLGERLYEAGRVDEAAKVYAELIQRKPTVAACRGLARIYREKRATPALVKLLGTAYDLGGTRELVQEEGEAIAKDADLLTQLIELARAPDQAKESLSYTSHVAVALLAIRAERFEVVEQLYERALAHPQAVPTKIHEAVGLALLFADQHQLAAKVLAQAIKTSPPKEKLAAYYFYLANAHELSGAHDLAMEAAEKCAELEPASPQFHGRPAWVLYHAKRLNDAEQRYRALLAKFDTKYDSEETRDQIRQARLILSNIAVMQQRSSEAEEWLEQVLDEFPEDVGAQNDLGYLWADQGKHLHRALVMCQAAVRSDPENGAYRDSLGWAHYRLGQPVDAARELEKAASLTPEGVIYDHLGDAYLLANEKDKALAAWEKAIESFTKEQDPEKIRQTKAKLEQHRK